MQGQNVALLSGAQNSNQTMFIEFLPICNSNGFSATTNRCLVIVPRGGMSWIKSSNVVGAGG
jgi:hypothetical protein